MGEVEADTQSSPLKSRAVKREQRWGSSWHELGFLFLVQIGEMIACLLMGLNSVERGALGHGEGRVIWVEV